MRRSPLKACERRRRARKVQARPSEEPSGEPGKVGLRARGGRRRTRGRGSRFRAPRGDGGAESRMSRRGATGIGAGRAHLACACLVSFQLRAIWALLQQQHPTPLSQCLPLFFHVRTRKAACRGNGKCRARSLSEVREGRCINEARGSSPWLCEPPWRRLLQHPSPAVVPAYVTGGCVCRWLQ